MEGVIRKVVGPLVTIKTPSHQPQVKSQGGPQPVRRKEHLLGNLDKGAFQILDHLQDAQAVSQVHRRKVNRIPQRRFGRNRTSNITKIYQRSSLLSQ